MMQLFKYILLILLQLIYVNFQIFADAPTKGQPGLSLGPEGVKIAATPPVVVHQHEKIDDVITRHQLQSAPFQIQSTPATPTIQPVVAKQGKPEVPALPITSKTVSQNPSDKPKTP
jgi:hypothetical protein